MVGQPEPAASPQAGKAGSVLGPAGCFSRDRAEDAAGAIKDMAKLLNGMDRETVKRLVHAREAAADVYKVFPEGDRRFDSVGSESEGEEEEIEGDGLFGEGATGELGTGEGCRGLFDDNMDDGPQACLLRAKEEQGFDIVAEMDKAKLDFFQRIRFVNYLRMSVVSDGLTPKDVIADLRAILKAKDPSVLSNDRLLVPEIQGDLLLTVLESEQDLVDSTRDRTDDAVIGAVQESLRASHIL